MYATSRASSATVQRNALEGRDLGKTPRQEFVFSRVYALRPAGSTFAAVEAAFSDLDDQKVRFAVCVSSEVACRRSNESPREGEPFGVVHDAFEPSGRTYSFFSGRMLGTGETVIKEGFIPNADVHFVELSSVKAQELMAMGPSPPSKKSVPSAQISPQSSSPASASPAPQKPAS